MNKNKSDRSNITNFFDFKKKKDHFEKDLYDGFNVDVPDDLKASLLSIPERERPVTSKKPAWGSMAASCAGVLLLFGSLMFNSTPVAHAESVIDTAYNHMVTTKPLTDQMQSDVPVDEVNKKLSPFGKTINTLPWKVRYVNHCNFGKKAVFQMIAVTDKGKEVSIYLVPNAKVNGNAEHDDKGVKKQVTESAVLVAVSEDKALSEKVMVEMTKLLEFDKAS